VELAAEHRRRCRVGTEEAWRRRAHVAVDHRVVE